MRKQLSEDEIKSIFGRRKRKGPKISKAKELRNEVSKLAAAITKNAALSDQRYIVHPYWSIELPPTEIFRKYPHLIVLTDVTPDGTTSIKLLKIELDSGFRDPQFVMQKMIGMTGYGLVLCPTITKFDRYVNAYKRIAKTNIIVTDGIYFGKTEHVLRRGILGPTFISFDDGSMVQFRPV